MSNFFRCFILLGLSSAVLCHNVRDDAPWFKERERITDRFLVGMINGRNTFCNTTDNGSQAEGVCIPARECATLGGRRGGACSFLGTCCILEKTCSNTTKSKLSYFVPPKVFQPDCSLTIKPMNRYVCQIRLDFVRFSIAKPTQADELFESIKSYQCNHDAFTVKPLGSNIGFLHLCGENTKQHIYVPVSNLNNVVLNFQLSPNRSEAGGTLPDWRIRIHQLECTRSPSVDLNQVDSSLAAMHHQHHQHHHRPNYNSDYDLIAPRGCLQYYPQRSGTYESFNFNNRRGPYIGTTNYAICFKNTPDICGIRHTAEFFVMNYNVDDQGRLDCHPNKQASELVSQDYLVIPGGMLNNHHVEFYCDELINGTTPVTAVGAGPLHVRVRTDSYRRVASLELGFRIHYQLLTTGCNPQ